MLSCYYDVTSPAAVVAVLRLQRLADAGAPVAFQGIDTLGLESAIPPTLDQLEQLDAFRDQAATLGLTMRRPSRRPPTLGCHLVAELAEQQGRGPPWRGAVFAAYWAEDGDVGNDQVLVDLAGTIGLDPVAIQDLLADRQARTALRRRMLAARSRGIGGVPVLEFHGEFLPADLHDDTLAKLVAL
jgi:predicted DsbA family dithiol-disulfide isomerase